MAPVCTSGSGEMPNMLKVHSYTLENSSIHVYGTCLKLRTPVALQKKA